MQVSEQKKKVKIRVKLFYAESGKNVFEILGDSFLIFAKSERASLC